MSGSCNCPYANNTDDSVVRRFYAGCEQTTKIIIMRLQNSLASEIQGIQFGTRSAGSNQLTLEDKAVRAQMKIEGSPMSDTHSLLVNTHFRIRRETNIATSRDVYKVHAYLLDSVETLKKRLKSAQSKAEKKSPLKYDEQILLQLEEQQQVSILCKIYSQPISGSTPPTVGFLTTFIRSFNGYMPEKGIDDRMARVMHQQQT